MLAPPKLASPAWLSLEQLHEQKQASSFQARADKTGTIGFSGLPRWR